MAAILMVVLVMMASFGVKAAESSDVTEQTQKTIVLVHGGWHGEWSWYKVKNILTDQGFNVVTIELPAHGNDSTCSWEVSLKDYEQKIISNLDSLGLNNVTLVGHGTSGVLISRVAELRPDMVEKIVFVGGVVASDNESISSVLLKDYKSVALKNARVNVLSGEIYIKENAVNHAIYNTVTDEDDLAICDEKVQGEPLLPLLCKIGLGNNYYSVPKYYIRTLQDNCVTPNYQSQLLGKTYFSAVYEMDTCHMPFISNPNDFVNIIQEITNKEEAYRIMTVSDPVDENNIDEVMEIHNQIVINAAQEEMSLEEYMVLFEEYQSEMETN